MPARPDNVRNTIIAPREPPNAATRTHRLFMLALLVKGVDGLIELAGGLLALFVPLSTVNRVVLWLTASEIENDPGDWLANTLIHAAERLSMGAKLYASFYLVSHGCVKIFLVYSLWREKLWAFPVALAVMGALVAYALYRFTHTHSLALLFFAAIDLTIMWFVWREYTFRRPSEPAGR